MFDEENAIDGRRFANAKHDQTVGQSLIEQREPLYLVEHEAFIEQSETLAKKDIFEL